MPTTTPARPRAARVWGEAWRLIVAILFGFLAFGLTAWEFETSQREFHDALAALDLLVGVLGLPLILLRRRAPLTIALLLTVAACVSVSVTGAAAIAVVSLATHRRWWQIVLVGVVFTASSWVYGALHPRVDGESALLDIVAGALSCLVLVWIGAYIGLRREHVASLRERAETAEREQGRRVAQARSTERARIAREMHDVLAHRMSLVAMHAGALAYRTDLPPEKVAETAAVVQSNAHEALVELREVLGVLRATDGPATDGDTTGPARPERPQPTLADLDELLDDARANGVTVYLERRGEEFDRLGEAVGRHAFRIVQEGLTNARKHAAWAPVTVVLEGGPEEGLSLVVRNPVRTVGPGVVGSGSEPAPPTSSLGLLGLTERAELTGGRLEYGQVGGDFVLRAWLPWAP